MSVSTGNLITRQRPRDVPLPECARLFRPHPFFLARPAAGRSAHCKHRCDFLNKRSEYSCLGLSGQFETGAPWLSAEIARHQLVGRGALRQEKG